MGGENMEAEDMGAEEREFSQDSSTHLEFV